MKRHAVVGVVVLLAVTALAAQAPPAIEKELLKLENDWATAWQKKDAVFLQKLCTEEYLATDAEGVTYTKAQDLANVASPGTSVTSFALSDMKVHVYGDTAVVTGMNTVKQTFKGKDMSGAFRFTDVFVKRDGRWQVVATQGTKVVKQ
jgi:ketosteroid isomerase-like protein